MLAIILINTSLAKWENRQEMPTTNSEPLYSCLKKTNNSRKALQDMTPICHIFNLSLEESLCPQAWREAKVIPLPKSGKAAFTIDQ